MTRLTDLGPKTKKANEGDRFCDDILSFIVAESSVEDNEDTLHAIMLAASLQGRRFRCPTHNVYERVYTVNRTPNTMCMLVLCLTTVSIVGNRLYGM